MKNLFLSVLLVCGMLGTAFAQSDYKSAIGGSIRSGYHEVVSGSFKTFITDAGALEFNLGGRGRKYGDFDWVTVAFSATYQHHFDIKPVPGLRWYVGGGLMMYNSFSDDDAYKGFGMGIYPTGGIDYKFANIPLNLSADIRPTISVVDPYDSHEHGYDYRTFNGDNFGISVRYTF
jgi:hypothetical protein